MGPDPLITTVRISMLAICMAAAARSDYYTLTVRDWHWIKWGAPTALLLGLELASNDVGFANIAMVFALITAFSYCFMPPPDISIAKNWDGVQASLFLTYAIGFAGLLGGAYSHHDVELVDLIVGEESAEATLWWSLLGALLTIVVFIYAWRLRLIQGSADVKALVLVTLMFPSWAFLPDQMFLQTDSIPRIPPSMALFIWAGAAFILAAPLIFVQNLSLGNISSIQDLKMAWHATKKPISDIGESPSWILTDVIENEGEIAVVNRILPIRKPISEAGVSLDLEALHSMGVEHVWVATKHPFIVYLFFAILPLLLFGDPISSIIK